MHIIELLMGIGRGCFLLGSALLLGGLLLLICSMIAVLPAGFIPGPVGVILSIPTTMFAVWLFLKVVKDTVMGEG